MTRPCNAKIVATLSAALPELAASAVAQTRSKTAAMPCPPPMHIVTSA
jgi:hypothetical protein